MPASRSPSMAACEAALPVRRVRLGWWLLAWANLGLAIAGAMLPVLPSVPFVLVAAWAAARGSPALHERLLADPRFGPVIRNWRAHGAVGRRAKWLATASMSLSALLVFWLAPWGAALFACANMALVALWLWLRPEPAAGCAGE